MSATATPTATSTFYPNYQDCTQVSDLCPVAATTYGYFPVLSVNIFFTIFFGLLLLIQIPITLRTRTWSYAAGLGIGTLLEFLGYIGRVLMHYNPWNTSAFEMGVTCLILAPSFIAASVYLTLKHLVIYYGPEHSRLKPRLYPWIFVGCDFGSIVLQAIGGGVASSANNGDSKSASKAKAGDDLIVAGIAFQVATMLICGALVVDYLLRLRKAKNAALGSAKSTGSTSTNTPHDSEEEKNGRQLSTPTETTSDQQSTGRTPLPLRLFWAGVVFGYLTILIRCIYRLPEMVGGWGNPRMRKENEFLLLDGMMIALGTLSLTILHPGYCFPLMRKGKKRPAATTVETA